jgi:ParB/RepB/Spo0J family partition protein
MDKLRGLSRGLDVLLGGNDNRGEDSLTQLSVDLLQPHRFQLRTRMDSQSIAELADSIKFQGLIQPIRVRPVDGGKYEIIAGERRWRAAQLAGLTQVPVVMRAVPDQTALAMALIENVQREDLNPLEEAAGIQRLVDEFDMTHDAAVQAVGRSRSAGPLSYEAACAWLEEFPRELAHVGPLGYEAARVWLDEFLGELAHDGPWGYEALCAWLEEALEEFGHDGPLDFDAVCAWLESTTRTASLTTQSVRAAAIPMVPEELRSDSR